MPTSKVTGFTELKSGGYLYWSHPSFCSGKPWVDWAMTKTRFHEELVPAKIHMFLDLSLSVAMSRMQQRRFLRDKDPLLPMDEWEESDLSDNEDSLELFDVDGDCLAKKGLWCVIQIGAGQPGHLDEGALSPYLMES